MTPEQLQTKVIYLTEENNRLRDSLLDAQIQLGLITLETPKHETAQATESEVVKSEVVKN